MIPVFARITPAPVAALSLLMIFCSCSAPRPVQSSSQSLPSWVDNPSNAYDDSRYLMAVGSGSTLREAHEDALSSLSRIFQAEIDASQELIDEFVETSRDDQFSSERTTQLLNVSRIGTNQELMNTEILQSEVVSNGTYYALAGMNRMESARIYNQEISNNDLKINEYETNASNESDLLQKLILLKKALVLAQVNENLSRQRNIILGGSSDRELNTQTLNRLQEKFRAVQRQVPVSIQGGSASETIVAAIERVFQDTGFTVAESDGNTGSGRPVLEVNVEYHTQRAELNRENAEFVKWELIIDIVNTMNNEAFRTFLTEGRDGALSYEDALKRADFTAREKIQNQFKSFLTKELFALN
ncbi:MAG: LPP20 family lipoprotein [Balneolaceae bacterium]|nr:LPP20 family lipoprotein [Balneolaceae bacterium]